MSGDIFKTWPEFLSDIPVYNSLPNSISFKAPAKQLVSRNDEWMADSPDSITSSRVLPAIEDVGRAIDEQDKQPSSSMIMSDPDFAVPAQDDFQLYTDFSDILLLPAMVV
jgi:hypothetical protein